MIIQGEREMKVSSSVIRHNKCALVNKDKKDIRGIRTQVFANLGKLVTINDEGSALHDTIGYIIMWQPQDDTALIWVPTSEKWGYMVCYSEEEFKAYNPDAQLEAIMESNEVNFGEQIMWDFMSSVTKDENSLTSVTTLWEDYQEKTNAQARVRAAYFFNWIFVNTKVITSGDVAMVEGVRIYE